MSHNFTADQIEGIGEVLRDAFLATYSNIGQDNQQKVNLFWVKHLGSGLPYMMVTDQGVADYAKHVFSDAAIRDFVLQLTSNFFLLWGASNDVRLQFISNVASSISVDLGIGGIKSTAFNAMPDNTRKRVKSFQETYDILTANSWLLILVIAPTFMSFTDFIPKETVKKSGARAA